MLKKSFIVASAIALILSLFSPAIAQIPRTNTLNFLASNQPLIADRLTENLKQNRGELLEKLNLSNDQRQQIQTIRQQYSPEMSNLSSQMRSSRATMKDLAQGNASRSQLENQYRAMSNLRKEIADLKFQQMMDIRDVLTVSQRQDLADYLDAKKKDDNWFGDR